MKVKLKQEIVDGIIKKFDGWSNFPSIYGCGNQSYSKDFLGVFFVEETDEYGVYRIVSEFSIFHLDHIDIIPEHFIPGHSFKKDILTILEA